VTEENGKLNYASILVQSKFSVILTNKRRRYEKNCIVGIFCTEIPLQVSFSGLKTDRCLVVIALVSVELKGNATSASVPEEQRVTVVYDVRENVIFYNMSY
jgi:hypothetical protein